MARVLVAGFCEVPGPHRSGVQVAHIMSALASRHSVDGLVVRTADQAYVEQYRKTRLLRVPVPEASLYEQVEAYRRALRRQLEGAEYDIVHFCDGWSGKPVFELSGRLELTTVFDVARGPMCQAPISDDEVRRRLGGEEQTCLARADLVLAPTPSAARHLAASGAGDRVRLVPPGVDVNSFDWEHAPPPGPARILQVGALRPGRALELLMRAMVEVAARTDARLVLAGPVESGFAPALDQLIASFGLGERVDRLGPIENDEMPRVLSSATICVVPTALELARQPTALYPTRLLEFMACRRVVVAPRRGTVAMVVSDMEHGLLFEPGDATDLAAQILRLLADPALRERLARAAYERVRHNFTASGSRRALFAAYALITAGLPERRPGEPDAAAPAREGEVEETAEVTDSQIEVRQAGARPPSQDSVGDLTAVETTPAPAESPVPGWHVESTLTNQTRFAAGELRGAAPVEPGDEPTGETIRSPVSPVVAAAPATGPDSPAEAKEASAPVPTGSSEEDLEFEAVGELLLGGRSAHPDSE